MYTDSDYNIASKKKERIRIKNIIVYFLIYYNVNTMNKNILLRLQKNRKIMSQIKNFTHCYPCFKTKKHNQ